MQSIAQRKEDNMRIEQQDLEKALKKTAKTAAEAAIYFKPEEIASFKRKISGLVEAEKEDPQKTPLFRGRSLERIGQAVFDLVYNTVYSEFKTQTDRIKNRVDIQKQLTIAGDYAFALLQNELGGREIPKDIFKTFSKHLVNIAVQMINLKKDKMPPSQAYYREQRRRNANELQPKLDGMMEELKKYPISPETLANLFGEYKALQQRQADHGRVWRFFHGKENERRTALMNAMREALIAHIPEPTLDEETTTPSEIAKLGEKLNITKAMDNHINAIEANPAEIMGYENYVDVPEEEKVKEEVKEQGKYTLKDCRKLLEVKYRPDMNNLEREKALATLLREAVTKNQIFAGDKTIRQLVTRNYIRANSAEDMVDRPDEWEKYCAYQDEEFDAEHPKYEAPKEIPEISKNDDVKEPLDGDKIKEDMGEKNVAIEDKRPEEPTVSSPNKSIG